MHKRIMAAAILLVVLLTASTVSEARINSRAIFDDVSKMTTEEIVAEMKYAIATHEQGKYYPADRMNALEQQLAKNQQSEIKRFQEQLEKDAEIARQIEEMKQKAIDEIQQAGDDYYEENKEELEKKQEEIKKAIEDKTRRMLGLSESEWQTRKDQFNEMYEKGSEVYEEHVKEYVEGAQKAYDAYNAYARAKTEHPEAPESAQNLVGFLNASSEVMKYAGEKMKDTPLRPIGEILNMYGEAAGLGDTAAKNAWMYTHRDGINPNVDSQYKKGLDQIGIGDFDYGGLEKSNIMMHDGNIRILKLANGNYAVFNDNFEIVPGSTGKTLTPAEYEKLEQLYVAFSNGRKEGWPDLTAEQLAQLARGEKIKVTVHDRIWPLPDEVQEFSADQVAAMGEKHAYDKITSDILTSLDRIINGDQTLLGGLFDSFTRGGRRQEIQELFSDYQKQTESFNSLIHDREAFLEWVKSVKEDNPDLTPEQLKEKLRELLRAGLGDAGAKADETEGKNSGSQPGEGTTGKNNPLIDELRRIDPAVKDANSSGVTRTGKSDPGTGRTTGGHWTLQTPEEFNGKRDGGFTNSGGTNRPMPGGSSPQSIGIPVLKPNIYVYPGKPRLVQVTFRYPMQLTRTIPEYTDAWKVIATPDGRLDGTYDFLFYEALIQPEFFQTQEGWKLPANNRPATFSAVLDRYRFNSQEKQDFIEFWTEKLEPGVDYIMYPQETPVIDRAMPVVIEPKPEHIHRIWFYFIPCEGRTWIEPEATETIERNGFTIVEWGGMYR